ncbi:unnamed protein product [Ectocarpus sp. 8 AP-2014]
MSEMGPVLDVGFERTVKVREDEVLACAYAGHALVTFEDPRDAREYV